MNNQQFLALESETAGWRRGQIYFLLLPNGEVIFAVYLGHLGSVPQFFHPDAIDEMHQGQHMQRCWLSLEEMFGAATRDQTGTFAQMRYSADAPTELHRTGFERAVERLQKICDTPAPNLKPVDAMPPENARELLGYPLDWPLCESIIDGLTKIALLMAREEKAAAGKWPEWTASIPVAKAVLMMLIRRDEVPAPTVPSLVSSETFAPRTIERVVTPVTPAPSARAVHHMRGMEPGSLRALLEEMCRTDK